jgi:hypothetical protein
MQPIIHVLQFGRLGCRQLALARIATASCSVNCPSATEATGVKQPKATAGCQADSAGLGS